MPERIPVIGGSQLPRSIIANAQRCINCYPELNARDAPSPVTLYQRPGLKYTSSPGTAGVGRGLYRASNGNGYAVVGQKVYSVSAAWVFTQLGTLTTVVNTPVSMSDNGQTLMLVDNSNFGYTIDLASNTFAQIVDPLAFFMGATKVDVIDTFLIWNMPGTRQWGSTLSDQVLPFDPTYIASKSDYPDPIQTLIVNRHEILLIGQVKSEIWYDQGGAQFPFAELPGAYIEHGTVAPYSVASQDTSVFWLSQDLQGIGYVIRQRGYETKIVSNPAISNSIRLMAAAGTIADAIGYTYTQNGHAFYVLTFPTGNQTWVFDDTMEDPMQAWHQEAWIDGNGGFNRIRDNCHAFVYGQNVVLDWQTGDLYIKDMGTYTDTVANVVSPIQCIRGFGHLTKATAMQGAMYSGQVVDAGGRSIQFSEISADIESGTADLNDQHDPIMIGLRWSTDRGRTFKETVLQSNGALGQYLTQPKWGAAGVARDMVFELSWASSGPAALNGLWYQAQVLTN